MNLLALTRQAGFYCCEDCGSDFSSFPGDTAKLCGNCSATTDLPRCGHRSIIDLGLGSIGAHYCQRPSGHTGQHTYDRRRS